MWIETRWKLQTLWNFLRKYSSHAEPVYRLIGNRISDLWSNSVCLHQKTSGAIVSAADGTSPVDGDSSEHLEDLDERHQEVPAVNDASVRPPFRDALHDTGNSGRGNGGVQVVQVQVTTDDWLELEEHELVLDLKTLHLNSNFSWQERKKHSRSLLQPHSRRSVRCWGWRGGT